MSASITDRAGSPSRGEPLRRRVLDAAERRLSEGEAEFSMRDLAAAAGVSFATPFNQFGSKAAIMSALSSRRIDAMETRYRMLAPRGNAVRRVRCAVEVAAAVMLQLPVVNRVLMGWLGSSHPEPARAFARSQGLWTLALGAADGLQPNRQALTRLPVQLAISFRGILSFWASGEIADREFAGHAWDMAYSLMSAYGASSRKRRAATDPRPRRPT